MGTWGFGPFDNDGAAQLLEEATGSPARAVTAALREVARAKPGAVLDVDVGAPAWAACELVALAFGRGGAAAVPDAAREVLEGLRPREPQRLLAITVLPRIADAARSELAGLWHEGDDGARFDAALADLAARLEAAKAGPRELPRAKAGDVVALSAGPGDPRVFVVQVIGAHEVVVFSGALDPKEALRTLSTREARRGCASANGLLARGTLLGNAPVRKEMRGKKLYGYEAGGLDVYFLFTASGGGLQRVSFDEASAHDVKRVLGEAELRAIALGTYVAPRLRSPSQQIADLRARQGSAWAARRAATTPGPFGDVVVLGSVLDWIDMCGVANLVEVMHRTATGAQGSGRPNEHAERRDYAMVGLVALWLGCLPESAWPATLASRRPPPPAKKLMPSALSSARALLERVITQDAGLRLIWDDAPDGGASLRDAVASLGAALGAAGPGGS